MIQPSNIRQLNKNAANRIEQVQEETPHKTAAVRRPNTHHKNHPTEANPTYGTLLEKVRTNS